jgi:hypothetical protein
MHTRYLIQLNNGSQMTVVEQNLDVTSQDARLAQGKEVRLMWPQSANNRLEDH